MTINIATHLIVDVGVGGDYDDTRQQEPQWEEHFAWCHTKGCVIIKVTLFCVIIVGELPVDLKIDVKKIDRIASKQLFPIP